MAHNSKVKSEDIVKLILDYYKLTGSEATYKSIEKKFSGLSPKAARDLILKDEIHLYTIIEPFKDISFDSIKAVSKMLKVPLDEYVTIKTEDGKTIKSDVPVPVGISYIQFLEHFSSQYMSVGGSVKYNPITRQPVKVGGGGNVSSIGNLDMNALITYEVPGVLEELLTARSDHHRIKRKMYSSIATNGELFEASDEDKISNMSGGTGELKRVYMMSLGLMMK